MYTFHSTVRFSECDERSYLRVHRLVDYLQDCATLHSESTGHGAATLAKRHLAWVITTWQVRIERMPCHLEHIAVSTWCPSMGAAGMRRDFEIQDSEGRRVAAANSLWACFDTEALRPVRVPPDEKVLVTGEPPVDLPAPVRRIAAKGEGESLPPIPVGAHHLDANHHVNNGRYVEMADAVVRTRDTDFEPALLQVRYQRPAKLGDVITPVLFVEDEGYAVDLEDDNGNTYAIVRLTRR